jgi:hypothetical protein
VLRAGLPLHHVTILEGFDGVWGEQSVAPEIDYDLVRGDWHRCWMSVLELKTAAQYIETVGENQANNLLVE